MNKLNPDVAFTKPKFVVKTSGGSLSDWMKLTNEEKRKFNGFEGFKKDELLGLNNIFSTQLAERNKKSGDKFKALSDEVRKGYYDRARIKRKEKEERINGK